MNARKGNNGTVLAPGDTRAWSRFERSAYTGQCGHTQAPRLLVHRYPLEVYAAKKYVKQFITYTHIMKTIPQYALFFVLFYS